MHQYYLRARKADMKKLLDRVYPYASIALHMLDNSSLKGVYRVVRGKIERHFDSEDEDMGLPPIPVDPADLRVQLSLTQSDRDYWKGLAESYGVERDYWKSLSQASDTKISALQEELKKLRRYMKITQDAWWKACGDRSALERANARWKDMVSNRATVWIEAISKNAWTPPSHKDD